MRKRNSLRLISVLLVFGIMIGLISVIYVTAADSYEDPNVVLLEAMLNGERKWVIDTIVEDNRNGNPYAENFPSTKKSLMATALSQYENMNDPNYRASYTVMVDLLTNFYYEATWDDDITAGLLDLTEEIIELFGEGDTALTDFIGDLKKTTEEQKFEAILEGVFTDTYTSSWGEKVNEQESSLQQLSEISASVENFKSLTSYWSALYGIADDSDSETIIDYQKNVINPLISSGQDYLKAFESMSDGEQAMSTVAITGASALAVWNWSASHSTTYSGITPLTTDLLDMVAGKEAIGVLDAMKEACSFATGAINQFTFLHSLCQQSVTFHDTLIRMSTQAANDGHIRMSGVLEDYAEQMDDVLYENQLSYNLLVDRLAETSTIKKNLKISKALKAGMPDSWLKAYSSSDLSVMTKVFNVGMFAIDEATGIKNTCIKLSEMKYLREMIREAKKVYYADLDEYYDNKNGTNAQKVLNDLLLLQRLRLRGENIAYKMTKGQLNSGIGKLVSGSDWQVWFSQEDTTEAEAWTQHYQHSIDCLIGASLNPVNYAPFEVNAGENLILYYDENVGSYCGTINGATIYEMQYRVMSGINLNGGKISMMDISVPFINVSNGTLNIDASTARIGELTQTGSMELNVTYADLEFETCLDLQNATVTLNGNSISSPDITLSGKNTFADGTVETQDLHLNTATVAGMINCTGDITISGNCTISDLAVQGTDSQTISNSLTVGNLTLNNTKTKGITTAGTVTVTGMLSDTKNIVDGNILLSSTADIAGGYVASDVTLNGTTVKSNVTYARSLTVQNGATVSGGAVKGSLTAKSGTLTNTGAALEVKNGLNSTGATIQILAPITAYEDSYFSNTHLSGTQTLALYGDVTFSSSVTADVDSIVNLYGNCTSGTDKSKNQLATLNLCGTSGQTVGFTGTVENLNITNTSLIGVEMTGSTYVIGCLTAKDQRISSGNNIILTGTATADLDNVSGHLQITDWNGTGFSGLKGTLYISGNNVISNDITLQGGIRQESGSMTLEGAVITCKESLECNGTWNLDADSALITAGDGSLHGTIANEGLIQAKNLTMAATLTGGGTLEITGSLINSKENTFGTLQFSGTGGQNVSGSKVTVENLIVSNNTQKGVTFDSPVYVTQCLTAKDQRITSGNNIILTGTAAADFENISGNLRIEDWTGSGLTGFNGTLYASGDNVISADITLRGGIRQTSGSISLVNAVVTCQESLECSGTWSIDANSALVTSGDGVFKGQIENDGRLKAQNLTLNGALSGTGTLEITGDLSNSKANTFGTLLLSGTKAQKISGSTITVTDLIIANETRQGVTFDVQTYVARNYENGGQVRGIQPIQLLDGTVFDSDATIAALKPNGDVVIGENVTVTVNGDVTTSGLLQLSSGAKLIVSGDFVGSSATIETASDSQINVRGNLRLSSAAAALDGTLTVWQDAILSGGTVRGAGTLVLNGDLTNSATIAGLNTLLISGRVPQTISGNSIHVARAVAENTSASGVDLRTTVYYSEEMSIAEGCSIAADQFMEG